MAAQPGAAWCTITGVNGIYDVAIAPQVPPGIRYVTVAGAITTGENNDPCISYFDLGAASPSWRNAVADPLWTNLTIDGVDSFRAIAFSPNFAADYTAVALSERKAPATDGIGKVQLHTLSFNMKNWNALWSGTPVTLGEHYR